MQSLFSPPRFARLWRAHWADNWRAYLRFVLVAVMVDLVLLLLAFGLDSGRSYNLLRTDFQVLWFFAGLFIVGSFFVYRHLESFGDAGATLLYLMRPASSLEKTVQTALMLCLVFPLVYTLGFALLHYPFVSIAESLAVHVANPDPASAVASKFHWYVPLRGLWDAETLGQSTDAVAWRSEMLLFLAFFGAQGIGAGGRIYFKRLAFVKTGLLCFALFLGFVSAGVLVGPHFYALIAGAVWDSKVGVAYLPWEKAAAMGICVGTPLLVWVANYFHLTEREVL